MANNLGSLTGSMGSVCRPGRAVRPVSGIVVWRLLIDGFWSPNAANGGRRHSVRDTKGVSRLVGRFLVAQMARCMHG